jgi:hypothetical protein
MPEMTIAQVSDTTMLKKDEKRATKYFFIYLP